MKAKYFSILLIAALCLVANATVYEAGTSEDVDLFLDDFQADTVALLFYDSNTDNQKDEDWFARLSTKILGIFMSSDQFGRSTEDWVELFDDKLHLMRVDVRNPENLRAREEFNIEDAPYIVLQDKRRTILREKIDEETYEHVRELLERRPNMLHKTGGAALKSFNLEPDSEAPETAPRVIQYFDLEEGSPTNVEAPVQNQYVNWAPVDVIGPDGQWEERGRNWVTSYEIPESGITNQKDTSRATIQQRIKDDPRPLNQPKPAAKPTAPAAKPSNTTGPTDQQRGYPQPGVHNRYDNRYSSIERKTAQFQNAPASQQGPQRKANGMPTRHPYHSSQYTGYGDVNSSHRKYHN